MTLGIDATTRYGLDVPPTEPLRESHLDSDNPYNTRIPPPGLPPTPIANPGLASMQAAAHPGEVDDLYYVRKPDKPPLLHGEPAGVHQSKNAHGY